MPNAADLYWNRNKEKSSSVDEFLGKSPASRFALGVTTYPVVVLAQTLIQASLNQLGYSSLSMGGALNHAWNQVVSLPNRQWSQLINTSLAPIGKQLFFGEFIQNYLLGEKLSSLIQQVAPKYAHYPNTRQGQILRLTTASLLYATFCQAVRPVSTGWGSAPSASPSFINDCAMAIFAGLLKEKTGSNLPGIGLYLAEAHLGV